MCAFLSNWLPRYKSFISSGLFIFSSFNRVSTALAYPSSHTQHRSSAKTDARTMTFDFASFVLPIAAVFMYIAAFASTNWVTANGEREWGLWSTCLSSSNDSSNEGETTECDTISPGDSDGTVKRDCYPFSVPRSSCCWWCSVCVCVCVCVLSLIHI